MSGDSIDDPPSFMSAPMRKLSNEAILNWYKTLDPSKIASGITSWRKDGVLMDTLKRPTHSDIFMEVAEAVAKRSTCPRRHVGAVLARNNRIIATGYNGSIPGALHCSEIGCLMVDNHCRRTVHAELNVILQCASEGISARGAQLFVTTAPCGECTKLFTAVGIEGVFYLDGDYVPEFTITDLYGPDTAFSWYVQKFTYSQPDNKLQIMGRIWKGEPAPTAGWPEVTGRES